MKSKMMVLLTFAAVLLVALAACSRNEESNVARVTTPLTAFDEPVYISIGREANPGGTFAPGESAFDNGYTRLLAEKFNIHIDVENSFDADGAVYAQTVALHAAAGTLPDTFFIDSGNFLLFTQLQQAGRLADLTDLWPSMIGGRTREAMEQSAITFEELSQFVTVDGRIYGITGGRSGFGTSMMWIRQDWLDELNMPIPRTLDEVAATAQAFVEHQPGGQANTIGIAMQPNWFAMGEWLNITPVFYALGAYPFEWVEDGNGRVINGSVAPQTRDALAVLHDWYERGILARDFLVMASGDEVRDTYVSTNAAGILFSAWWQPWPSWDGHGPYSRSSNPDVNWVPVLAPLNNQNQFVPMSHRVVPEAQVILSSASHPEAVIIAMNYLLDLSTFGAFDDDPNVVRLLSETRAHSDTRTNAPIRGGIFNSPDVRLLIAQAATDLMRTGTANFDPRIDDFSQQHIWGAYNFVNNSIMPRWDANQSEADAEEAGVQYIGYKAFYRAPSLFLTPEFREISPSFVGVTDGWLEFGGTLDDMVNTAFIQFIAGVRPLSEWDAFVAEWYRAGGDVATSEVNDALGRE